jgi:hypothetical protein
MMIKVSFFNPYLVPVFTSSPNIICYTQNSLTTTKMKSIAIQLCALIVTLLTITIGSATADANFTPILPPSYPLAVRNPYLSGEFFRRLHNSH